MHVNEEHTSSFNQKLALWDANFKSWFWEVNQSKSVLEEKREALSFRCLNLVAQLIVFLDQDLFATKPYLTLALKNFMSILDFCPQETKILSYLYVKMAQYLVQEAEKRYSLTLLDKSSHASVYKDLLDANDALLTAQRLTVNLPREPLREFLKEGFQTKLNHTDYQIHFIEQLLTTLELKLETFLLTNYIFPVIYRQLNGVRDHRFSVNKVEEVILTLLQDCLTCGSPSQALNFCLFVLNIYFHHHNDQQDLSEEIFSLEKFNEKKKEIEKQLAAGDKIKVEETRWYQSQTLLRKKREKLKSILPPLDLAVSPESCSDFQATQHQEILSFLRELWHYSEKRFGPLPCACRYSLVLLGSLARGEGTAYSDIEYLILLHPEDVAKDEYGQIEDYFYHVNTLFQWTVFSCGESKLQCQPYNVGIHVDETLHPPSMWDSPDKQNGTKRFLTTPDKLVDIFFKNSLEGIRGQVDFNQWSLMNSLYIYGDVEPYTLYLNTLQRMMSSPIPNLTLSLGEIYALYFLNQHTEEFFKAYERLSTKPSSDLKALYLNYFKFLCGNLAWYHQLLPRQMACNVNEEGVKQSFFLGSQASEPLGVAHFLQQLVKKNYLHASVAIVWEDNFHLLQYLRSCLHFQWASQNDELPDLNEQQKTLLHNQHAVVTKVLEKVLNQTLLPFYSVVKPNLSKFWTHQHTTLLALNKLYLKPWSSRFLWLHNCNHKIWETKYLTLIEKLAKLLSIYYGENQNDQKKLVAERKNTKIYLQELVEAHQLPPWILKSYEDIKTSTVSSSKQDQLRKAAIFDSQKTCLLSLLRLAAATTYSAAHQWESLWQKINWQALWHIVHLERKHVLDINLEKRLQVTGVSFGGCVIRPEMQEQLINPLEKFINSVGDLTSPGKVFKEPDRETIAHFQLQSSLHLVIPLYYSRGKEKYPLMIAKVSPSAPAMDNAIHYLHELLTFQPMPQAELARLTLGKHVLSPVLFTEAVIGHNLKVVLEKSPELLQALDEDNAVLTIIFDILTSPADGWPRNWMLRKLPNKEQTTWGLVNVDSDQVFVSPFSRGTFGKMELKILTATYCLNEMKKPIPNSVKAFIQLWEPWRILRTWLAYLNKQDEQYRSVFSAQERSDFYRRAENPVLLMVALPTNTVLKIQETIYLIQQYLENTENPVPFDLLQHCYPEVAKRYGVAFNERKTNLNTRLNGVSEAPSLSSIAYERLQFENTFNYSALENKEAFTVEKALETLMQYANGVNEKHTIRRQLLEGKTSMANNLAPREKEALINSFDFRLLTPEQQEIILQLAKGIPLTRLVASYTQPSTRVMQEIFQNDRLDKLLYLDLTANQAVDILLLKAIAKNCRNLERLYLNNLKILSLYQKNSVTRDEPLTMLNLQRLSLQDCSMLERCEWNLPKLRVLHLNRTLKIQTLNIIGERYILDLSSSKDLDDEILARYVIGCRGVTEIRLKGCIKINFSRTKSNSPDACLQSSENLLGGLNIFQALVKDNRDALEWLLTGPRRNLDLPLDNEQNSALLLVITSPYSIEKKLTWIEFLIKEGANVNYQNFRKETALFLAATQGNKELVQHLLEHQATPLNNFDNETIKRIWFAAITAGDFLKMECLVLANVDINMRNEVGDNALFLVLQSSSLSTDKKNLLIPFLLEKNIDINHRNQAGQNILHLVLTAKDIDARQFFAKKKFDEEILNKNLFYQAKLVDYNNVAWLLEQGASIQSLNEVGDNALFIVLQSSSSSTKKKNLLIKFLVEKNIDINHRNQAGENILHLVLAMEDINVRQCFTKTKFDEEILNKNLFYQASLVDYNNITWLLEQSASIQSLNEVGDTLLLAVIKANIGDELTKVKIVEKLLRLGADINSVDCEKMVSLEYALAKGYQKLVALLIKEGTNKESLLKCLLMAAKTLNDNQIECLLKHHKYSFTERCMAMEAVIEQSLPDPHSKILTIQALLEESSQEKNEVLIKIIIDFYHGLSDHPDESSAQKLRIIKNLLQFFKEDVKPNLFSKEEIKSSQSEEEPQGIIPSLFPRDPEEQGQYLLNAASRLNFNEIKYALENDVDINFVDDKKENALLKIIKSPYLNQKTQLEKLLIVEYLLNTGIRTIPHDPGVAGTYKQDDIKKLIEIKRRSPNEKNLIKTSLPALLTSPIVQALEQLDLKYARRLIKQSPLKISEISLLESKSLLTIVINSTHGNELDKLFIILFLLEANTDLTQKDKEGFHPLDYALKQDYRIIASLLIASNLSEAILTDSLFSMIKIGKKKSFWWLIENPIFKNILKKDESKIIFDYLTVCQDEPVAKLEVIKGFFELGFSFNKLDETKKSPLDDALEKGEKEISDFYFKQKPSEKILEDSLWLAAKDGRVTDVALLLEHRAPTLTGDRAGDTLLLALAKGSFSLSSLQKKNLVSIFLQYNFPINLEDTKCLTALEYFLKNSEHELAELLITSDQVSPQILEKCIQQEITNFNLKNFLWLLDFKPIISYQSTNRTSLAILITRANHISEDDKLTLLDKIITLDPSNIHHVDSARKSCLIYAFELNQLKISKFLAKKTPIQILQQLLYEAIRTANISKLKKLFDCCPSVMKKIDDRGNTPLLYLIKDCSEVAEKEVKKKTEKNIIDLLLDFEVNINQPDSQGKNVLDYALARKQKSLVGYLLSKDMNTKIVGELLIAACKKLDFSEIISLIEPIPLEKRKQVLNFSDLKHLSLIEMVVTAKEKPSTISKSIEDHKLEMITYLVKEGAEINISSSGLESARELLYAAIRTRDISQLKKVFGFFPILMKQNDRRGDTPLLYLVKYCSEVTGKEVEKNIEESMIDLLLQFGVNINQTDNSQNKNVLDYALEGKQKSLIGYFVSKGAKSTKVIDKLLKAACKSLNFSEIVWLIESTRAEDRKQLLNSSDLENLSLIEMVVTAKEKPSTISKSIEDHKLEMITYLVKEGAEINISSSGLESARELLYAAIRTRNISQLKKIFDFFAILMKQNDKNGDTPLLYLIKHCSEMAEKEVEKKVGENVIDLLLKFGVDINQTDSQGKNVLDYALKEKRKSLVEYLISKRVKSTMVIPELLTAACKSLNFSEIVWLIESTRTENRKQLLNPSDLENLSFIEMVIRGNEKPSIISKSIEDHKLEIITYLIKQGAEIEGNASSKNFLLLALNFHYPKIVFFFLSQELPLEMLETVFHQFIASLHHENLEMLLQKISEKYKKNLISRILKIQLDGTAKKDNTLVLAEPALIKVVQMSSGDEQKQQTIIAQLLKFLGGLNKLPDKGEYLLEEAFKNKLFKVAAYLIKQPMDRDVLRTCFFKMVDSLSLVTVECLLRCEPSIVHYVDGNNRTALIRLLVTKHLSDNKRVEMVKLLLTNNINPFASDIMGFNASYYAEKNDYSQIRSLLPEKKSVKKPPEAVQPLSSKIEPSKADTYSSISNSLTPSALGLREPLSSAPEKIENSASTSTVTSTFNPSSDRRVLITQQQLKPTISEIKPAKTGNHLDPRFKQPPKEVLPEINPEQAWQKAFSGINKLSNNTRELNRALDNPSYSQKSNVSPVSLPEAMEPAQDQVKPSRHPSKTGNVVTSRNMSSSHLLAYIEETHISYEPPATPFTPSPTRNKPISQQVENSKLTVVERGEHLKSLDKAVENLDEGSKIFAHYAKKAREKRENPSSGVSNSVASLRSIFSSKPK